MILYFVTLCYIFGKIESLTCLSCKNISQQDNCTSVITCNVGHKCYTTAVGIGQDTVFNLGCRSEQDCLGQSSPSIVGRSVGEQCSQCCTVDRCNQKLCSAGTQEGGWSSWSSWSSCSGGRKTRTRACDNPKPSQFGRDCPGNGEQWDVCEISKETGGPVAFTVTTPNHTLVNFHPLFTKIVTNVGGGYSPSTGIFTCPVDGLYLFSLSVMAYGGRDVSCWIQKNGANIGYASTDGTSTGYNMASNSVYFQLSVGDKVSLGFCRSWDHVYLGPGSSFSGSLIN